MLQLKNLAVILFAMGFHGPAANAIIDMKNGNYSNTFVDYEVTGAFFQTKFERTYNSRSVYSGNFGYGWCSELETKIERTPEGNLRLIECGAGQQLLYIQKETGRKEIEASVATILEILKKDKKYSDKLINGLKTELVTNTKLRTQYGLDLKIARPIKEGAVFNANNVETDKIVLNKGVYVRSLLDGSNQRYNEQGKLTHIYDKNGNFLKMEYDKNLLKEVVDNNGRRFKFTYGANNKVQKIKGPASMAIEYKYVNQEDLSWVKNSWGNIYSYEYDDLHNMTKTTFPDKKNIVLTYDKKNDWVLSFKDRENCLEKYDYEFSENEPERHYWTSVNKTCGTKVTNESRHEFWYKERADGQVYLGRVLSKVNKQVTDVSYNETNGRPISIVRGDNKYDYDYFPTGLIRLKDGPFGRLTYKYDDTTLRVREVKTETYGQNKKVTRTKVTEFRHDNKGNLIEAWNSDGEKVVLGYDDRGRMAKIVDQAKKLVEIKYEEKNGRPAILTRPGMGTLKVTYKDNGDMELDKNSSASVGLQILSTFNTMLAVIAPATAELYN